VVEIEDGDVGELRQERGGHLAQPSPQEVDSRNLAADGLGRATPAQPRGRDRSAKESEDVHIRNASKRGHPPCGTLRWKPERA
jgi:hypothetical protein